MFVQPRSNINLKVIKRVELTNIKLLYEIYRDLGPQERKQGQEKFCLDCSFQLIPLVLHYFGQCLIYDKKRRKIVKIGLNLRIGKHKNSHNMLGRCLRISKDSSEIPWPSSISLYEIGGIAVIFYPYIFSGEGCPHSRHDPQNLSPGMS